jgi:hypothetical protein
MKLTNAIILIASIASHALASGNLRSSDADVDPGEELEDSVVGALLRMKENPKNRLLEGSGSDTMTSMTLEEKKKKATLEKLLQKKQNVMITKKEPPISEESNPEGAAEPTSHDADLRIAATRGKFQQSKQYLKRQKEPITAQSNPEDDESTDNNDIGVRIVGGEQSDANEFPYYGTPLHLGMSPFRKDVQSLTSTLFSLSQLT